MEEMLRKLIDKGIELSPAIWEVFMRQAIVNGLYQLFVSVVLLVAVVALGVFARRRFKEEEEGAGDYFDSAIAVFVVLIHLVVFLITLYSAFSNLVNPEYAAAQMILSMIR